MRPHPDVTTTASWLEGRLDPGAREAFEAHLASCSPCRSGVRVLREALGGQGSHGSPAGTVPPGFLEAAAGRAGSAAPVPRLAAPRHRLWPAAAAALVVIAGGAIAAWRWGPVSVRDDGAVPPAAGVTVYRGAGDPFADASPPPGAAVSRDDLAFSWSPVEGADRYRVLVMASNGETLARLESGRGETRVAWHDLPPPAPGPLLWRVQALAFDRVIAESRPIPFDVR